MSSKTRELNGYIVVYCPTNPSSMTNKNWNGWVYEHILVAESLIGRKLHKNECVHHLDCNRSNNQPNNLLVLDKGQHAKLHVWLDRGAPICESYRENDVNSRKPKVNEQSITKKCKNCGQVFFNQNKSVSFCSQKCSGESIRKVTRPTKEELQKLIWQKPFTRLGKDYGVSDNAIRKWCKAYSITDFPPRGYWLKTKATLSETKNI